MQESGGGALRALMGWLIGPGSGSSGISASAWLAE